MIQYTILNQDTESPLIQRILANRNIDCDINDFYHPTFSKYRLDPFLLSDMDKAITKIQSAIKSNHKIMIFGDYDVDGITSSWSLYTFFQHYLGYKNVSIMFPHRRHDGYGLKNKHLDTMKEKNIDLVITVDNGITSVAEAQYAKKLGLDLIITDHHHAGKEIPECHALINPHTSPEYSFKGICGAGVAFKLICAFMTKTTRDAAKKKEIFNYFLPIIAIATVADVVPLTHENRTFVYKGLQLINQRKIPASLNGFLDFLNIKGDIDTFHIGFLIGPRINAGGRVATPYDSLATLLYEGDKQVEKLQELEDLNTHRKSLQDEALKDAKIQINLEQKILTAYSADYHEGIVGIVAGRITEAHCRPSLIMYINEEQGTASGSLRCPPYFNIVKMLQHESISPLLEKFGGHKQAGGLTTKKENIEPLINALQKYCHETITDNQLIKNIEVDAILTLKDTSSNGLDQLHLLAPFGQGNKEPILILQDVEIIAVEKIGKKGNGHLKLTIQHGTEKIKCMFWRKGGSIEDYETGTASIIGKIKTDTFSGGRFFDGMHYIKN